MKCKILFAGVVCVLLLVLSPVAHAQDGQQAEATTTSDVEVTVENLGIMLKPLDKAELEVELAGWMRLLKETVSSLAQAELDAKTAEGDAKTELLNQASQLREVRAAIIARIEKVIKSYEKKGGDAAEQQQYIGAVSGIEVDVTDATGAWITVKNWLTSKEGGIKYGLNIVRFLVTLLVFWIVTAIVAGVARRAVKRIKNTSALLQHFLVGITRKTIMVVGLVVAVSQLGVDIGPLVAAIGAAGLVVGFALQGTLSNFASGIMILFYRPFDVGDWINVAGVSGKVDSMTLVSTSITSADNQAIVVPNNSIWNGVITNVTGNRTRRVDLTIGVSYNDDLDKTWKVLEEVVKAHPLVLDDPALNIQVANLGDSSVDFIVRPWCKTEDYWTVLWDLTKQIKQRLDAEGISIPFPQRDIHVHQHSE